MVTSSTWEPMGVRPEEANPTSTGAILPVQFAADEGLFVQSIIPLFAPDVRLSQSGNSVGEDCNLSNAQHSPYHQLLGL